MASVDIVAIAGFVVDDEEAVDQQLQFLLHSESYIDNMWTPIPLLFSASLFRWMAQCYVGLQDNSPTNQLAVSEVATG